MEQKQDIDYMFCGVLGIGFIYLFLVTFTTLPESGVEHAKTIVGFVLGTVISTLVGYRYGTSKGSGEKSKALEKESEEKTKIIDKQIDNQKGGK